MTTQATGPSAPGSTPSKSSKKREKKNSQASGASSERLKVVVRRLPPDLPEEIFWKSVEPWVSQEKVSWKAFYPGKARKRYVLAFSIGRVSEISRSSNKENISSRAYIGFKSQEQVATFGREYDGHAFKDKSGT
jgi:regulator of nonsense transcripts 3